MEAFILAAQGRSSAEEEEHTGTTSDQEASAVNGVSAKTEEAICADFTVRKPGSRQ